MRALVLALAMVSTTLGCTAEILPSQVALADTGAPLDAEPGLDVVTATTADVGPRDASDGGPAEVGPAPDAADAGPEDVAVEDTGPEADADADADAAPPDTLEPVLRDARTGLDATPIVRDGGTIPDAEAAPDA
jgi:hypothetical protein